MGRGGVHRVRGGVHRVPGPALLQLQGKSEALQELGRFLPRLRRGPGPPAGRSRGRMPRADGPAMTPCAKRQRG